VATFRRYLKQIVWARTTGYAAAVAVPIAITYGVAWLDMRPFVFEHLAVLLVLSVAIPWGLGPAVVAALVSVVSDNVLLREPVGRPTITGYRDVLDLALFATVAIVVSGLMRRAHTERLVAKEAAQRERRVREERDRLIDTITHDLATPLAILNGTVQFARYRGATAEVDWSVYWSDWKRPVQGRHHWSRRCRTRGPSNPTAWDSRSLCTI
jgi:K+-sensing histidine kinase KdpD